MRVPSITQRAGGLPPASAAHATPYRRSARVARAFVPSLAALALLATAAPGPATAAAVYAFAWGAPTNASPATNRLTAGALKTIRFSLGGDKGTDILAAGWPRSQRYDCATGAFIAESQYMTRPFGVAALSYSATSELYSYAWSTREEWSGTCRQFQLRLDDGVTRRADFHIATFHFVHPPTKRLPNTNAVVAGTRVPVVFDLAGDRGTAIFAAGWPRSQQFDCASGRLVAGTQLSVAPAGATGLRYSPTTGDYTKSWQTRAAWAGTCRLFQMKMRDGSVELAKFAFASTNEPPVAVDDAGQGFTTDEDASSFTTANVLANDTDADGDTLSITSLSTAGTDGHVTDNGDGTFRYVPAATAQALAPGEQDADSFEYTVSDGNGASDQATVTITITGVNDAPTAVDDSGTGFSTSESTSFTTPDVLTNDTDPESDALVVSSVDATSTHGASVTANGDGTFEYDPADAFALGAGDSDTDTFQYTVSDGQGGTDTATVTVTVSGDPNNAPIAGDDPATGAGAAFTVDEDGPHFTTGDVLANDTDADGDTLTVSAVGATSGGGMASDNGDGTFEYDPNGKFEALSSGETASDTFSYTVSDGHGGTDTATVAITINGSNDAPVATADTATVGEDTTGTAVPVLDNDTDVESQTLTVTGVDTTGTSGVVTNNGTDVSYDPNGIFEYLDDTETATDTFSYTVTDSQGGTDTETVTITVSGANDAPVASDDGPFQTFTDQNVSLTAPGVLANDTDEDGEALTAGNASDPANGTVTLNPDGSFSYTPNTGYNGVDSFTYDVTDGTTTDTATVTIAVVPANAAPTADDTSASGNEDGGAITVTLTGHDDDGDALTFTTGTATNGLVTVPANVSCDANVPSVCAATVTYTPNADFNGTDSFTYTVNDGTTDSAPATATMTVTAVNDAPSFTKGADQTVTEDAGAQTVSGWATAISEGPANESAQSVSFEVTGTTNDALFLVLPSVSTSGDLTYTTEANANGAATVTVRVTDDGGTANGGVATSPTQTFTITVTAVNDVPNFTKGADQTVNEDAGAQSMSNWATAISKGPADESAQSLSFTTSNDDNALFSVQPGVTPTGTLVYTPASDAVGSATVTVSLSDTGGTANGGDDSSDSQTFTITVSPINDAPVAAAKAYSVRANMKISLGGLLTGATDPNDVTGDPSWTPSYTVGSITAGASCIGCTISNVDITNGTFDFDPPAGGTGTYAVTYTVVDSGHPAPGATSAAQTITFTVNGPVVWFVDTTAAAGGTGRLSAPFNSLPSATTAMGTSTNHRIFVRGGNVTGNVTLQTDGWLISEAATGASFDSVMGFTPPAGTIARPAVNGTQRTVTGTVTLGNDSTVRGVDVSQSGSNKGLVASGKTGLTVNQVAISTGAGRAVDLANSSGVLSLRKVDTNGADRGISLVNTNVSTGSFTITGSGTAGSGGTINASTGTAIGEAGIYLNNTKAVSLSRLNITSGAGNGIYANTVAGFALNDSTISGNGTNELNDHSGINGANVTGTVTLDTITVSGSREDNARILNNTGAATITVSNSTFRDNNASVGANGLYIDSSGSGAITFTSTNNTFQRNHTSGLAIFAQSSQRMNTTVSGGTYVTDNGVGLDIETNGTGGMQFSVTGGTVTGCASCAAPVVIYKGTGATGTGTSGTNGTLSGMSVTNGASLNAPGIWVHGEGPGSSRLAITNNTVSQVGHYGILVSFGNNGASPNFGAQTVDVSVTGNNVNHTAVTGSLEGIFVDSGLLSADTTVTCANISGNTITQPTDDDVRVRNRQAGTSLRLPGYAGSATDHTAVANFLKAQNTIADAFSGANASSNGIAGGAACATP